MNTISSYAHSFRKRKTARGEVYDVMFRVVDENGVLHQKVLSGFATKKLGEKAYMDYISKKCVFKEKDEEFKRKHIKFEDAAKLYLEYSEAVVSVGTLLHRREYFEIFYMPHFKGKNIDALKAADILRWFDKMLTTPKRKGGGNYSPRTIKNVWAQLSAFFSWCATRYSIKNPATGVSMPKLKIAETAISFWDESQFKKFIDSVDDVFWQTFFMFQFFTGCRVGETLALQESDFDGNAVKITKSLSKKTLDDSRYLIKTTKTGKVRTVPLPTILKEQFARYLAWKRENDISNKFLFCGQRGDYLPHTNIRRAFDLYTAKAELPRIRVHDLRHSYVSMLIHKGVNLAVIADLIGDTLEQVTNTYGHMYESDKMNAVAMLGF